MPGVRAVDASTVRIHETRPPRPARGFYTPVRSGGMQGIDRAPVHPLQGPAGVPSWDDIKDIISDLRRVLDNMDETNEVDPRMRVPIARVIAHMREEKALEEGIDRCKELLQGLNAFWVRDGGILSEGAHRWAVPGIRGSRMNNVHSNTRSLACDSFRSRSNVNILDDNPLTSHLELLGNDECRCGNR